MQLHPTRALCLLLLTSSLGRAQTVNSYKQTNLISDGSVPAQVTDKTLINPWGVAIGQQTPFWINNAGSGTSAVYDAGPNKQFAVKIPSSGAGTSNGSPAGIVFNSSPSDFVLDGGAPALFIFSGLDGTISAWNASLTDARRMVDNSSAGAVYTGTTLVSNGTGSFILAANMGAATIDVFDTKFAPASLTGKFVDPTLPAGFAPFNVHALGGKVFVMYAMQTPGGGPPTTGAGVGFVSVFDTSGKFLSRAISGGALNAPWGIALAPASFGAFGGDLLVANFGDGTINAFDPNTFAPLGQLQDSSGKPIQNDRLWEIVFGQNAAGDPNTLYFSAGVNDEKGGLFGSIAVGTVASAGDFSLDIASSTLTVAQGGSAALNISITASDGFNGPVTFSASGLPPGVAAQFSPAAITPTSGQTTGTTLTLTANQPALPGPYGFARDESRSLGTPLIAGGMLPIGTLCLLLGRRSKRRCLSRSIAGTAILLIATGSMALTGCGKSTAASSNPSAPTGTFAVTVTASSGAVSHAKTFSLAVQ